MKVQSELYASDLRIEASMKDARNIYNENTQNC